jgi:glycosyltransferase involved in cell wall biosynthesis
MDRRITEFGEFVDQTPSKGVKMLSSSKKIGMLILSDPHIYPPTMNAANILAEEGHRVFIYGVKSHKSKEHVKLNPSVQLIYLSDTKTGLGGIQTYLKAYIQLLVESIRNKFDWIIAYDASAVGPAFFASKLKGSKWIYHQHDFWQNPIGLWQKFLHKLEYKLGSRADIVSFPQEERAKIFREKSKMKNLPLIVYNGPRLKWAEGVPISSQPLQALKERFKHILIYQGGISKYFGFENLIRSINFCKSTFAIVFIGKELETGMKEELSQLALKNGVDERVVFLESLVEYDQLPSITGMADIGIAKLTNDETNAPFNDRFLAGASNKLTEYMAMGLPIISADTEDNRKFFLPDQIGVLCDTNVPRNIAATIDKLLGDEHYRHYLSEINRKNFADKYNYDLQFRKILEIINQ